MNTFNLNQSPAGPMAIDVKALYRQYPIVKDAKASPANVPMYDTFFHKLIYRQRIAPLPLRQNLRKIFRKINLDDLWMSEFGKYWSLLGGRPFWHASDFFYLRNHFRMTQGFNQDSDAGSSDNHLEKWQKPCYLYQLFHAVFKESFSSSMGTVTVLKKLKKKYSRVLEYGCGTAPITSAMIEYGISGKNCEFTIADLESLAFHFSAAYKFKRCSNVRTILLSPDTNFQIDTKRKFDVIFCCEVFEHLNDPLETVKRFHEMLDIRGLLIFDYVKSEAKGLDSIQGLEQRRDVLGFISKKFCIRSGTIEMDKNVQLVAAEKIN